MIQPYLFKGVCTHDMADSVAHQALTELSCQKPNVKITIVYHHRIIEFEQQGTAEGWQPNLQLKVRSALTSGHIQESLNSVRLKQYVQNCVSCHNLKIKPEHTSQEGSTSADILLPKQTKGSQRQSTQSKVTPN